jgi:UDP-3-O-[3-hydroxymyristoyl] glucosamine N-acyltransferase
MLDSVEPLTTADLVAALPGVAEVVGDTRRRIECITTIESPRAGALCFSKSPAADLADRAGSLRGTVIIAPRDGADDSALSKTGDFTLVKVDVPRAYFIRAVIRLVGPERLPAPGRSASAMAAPEARIGADVHLGAGVTIGAGAVIGARCVLNSGVQIHDRVELGPGTVVEPNAVIGCQGQSFVRDVDGTMLAMPHFGRVLIGANVRVGANTTIVRGTLRDTIIGRDTSIGNNVNIGHNVVVGARCFVGAGAILAGSSAVGDDSWISIGAILRGVAVGREVTIGAGAVVTRPIADGKTANGFPARLSASEG